MDGLSSNFLVCGGLNFLVYGSSVPLNCLMCRGGLPLNCLMYGSGVPLNCLMYGSGLPSKSVRVSEDSNFNIFNVGEGCEYLLFFEI